MGRYPGEQAVLPRPAVRGEFLVNLPSRFADQTRPLLLDRLANGRHRGRFSVEMLHAPRECLFHQVQKVRATNPSRRRSRQLPGEQIDQGREFSGRLVPAARALERGARIDEENPSRANPLRQDVPPVFADILVFIRVRLNENEVGSGRRGQQFIEYPGAAILLLGGGYQEDVAMGQKPPQAGQIRFLGRIVPLGGVRVGTIHQNQTTQGGGFRLDDTDHPAINAHHVGGNAGAADEHRLVGGRTLLPHHGHFLADECIHKCRLPRACPPQSSHDQWGIRPNAKRIEPLHQPVDECLALPRTLPLRGVLVPRRQFTGQRVDFREEFQLGEFGTDQPDLQGGWQGRGKRQ